MALPVWIVVASKYLGKLVVANGPQLVDLARTYGPPAYRGYKQHGFKPVKIVTFARAEIASPAAADGEVAITEKPKTKRAKRKLK